MVEILDPRLKRLDLHTGEQDAKSSLDQLPTFEVFVQLKETRAYKHEGCVHATSLALAFIFAKEQYSRRGTCSGIWVISTSNIYVTDYTDNQNDVYDQIDESDNCNGDDYSIFHMTKRGTHHSFVGEVSATTEHGALSCAAKKIDRTKPVLNVWLARTELFLKTTETDKELWATTPDKLFREAIDYKTGDKLKAFKIENNK